MNLRTFLSTFLFLILLLASCKEKEEKKQHALPAPMEEIDTTSMKKSLLHEIKNYVNQYDSCNAFLLYPTFFYKLNNDQDYYDDFKYNEIFCIGKISSASFGDSEFRLVDHYPHRYFKIGQKYIFISSRDDILYDQRKLEAIIDSMVPRGFRDVMRRELLIYTLKDSCVVHPQDSTNNVKFLFYVSEKFTVPTKE